MFVDELLKGCPLLPARRDDWSDVIMITISIISSIISIIISIIIIIIIISIISTYSSSISNIVDIAHERPMRA